MSKPLSIDYYKQLPRLIELAFAKAQGYDADARLYREQQDHMAAMQCQRLSNSYLEEAAELEQILEHWRFELLTGD
jgi:hypothetical protein